jgi:PPM family protein phosphatase
MNIVTKLYRKLAGQPTLALAIRGAMVTNAGRLCDHNEDRAAYLIPDASGTHDARGAIALVADGMGGHAAGEVASDIAAMTIPRAYYDQRAADPHTALRRAFQAANDAIHRAAQQDPACRSMGTTCTALAITGGRAYAAHVGDSRLYLFRDGRLTQLTQDHSLVGDLLRAGEITPEQARSHFARNIILRALGLHPTVEVSLLHRPVALRAGDRFLLCSDGLTDLVPNEAIRSILATPEPDAACRRLVERALEAGGTDNITAGVFVVGPPMARPAARATRTHQVMEATT